MSAFIIKTKTMNEVVNAICMKRARVFADFPVRTHAERTALGRALYAMNADAVRARYGLDDDLAPGYSAEVADFTYEPMGARLNRYQALKSVLCLLYQCSEGQVPETKLYKRLDRVSGEIAREIVTGLPEYERASWDQD